MIDEFSRRLELRTVLHHLQTKQRAQDKGMMYMYHEVGVEDGVAGSLGHLKVAEGLEYCPHQTAALLPQLLHR